MSKYSDIQKIKEQKDLPSVAEQYGVCLQQSGDSFMARCPFHDDRNPSFQIKLTRNGWTFFCYSASCGAKGDVIDFVGRMKFGESWNSHDKEMFKEVIKDLRDDIIPVTANREILSRIPISRDYQEITARVMRVWDLALSLYADILWKNADVLDYPFSRGFTKDTIKRFRMGYCPPNGSGLEHLAKLAGYSLEDLHTASIFRTIEKNDRERTYEYFWDRIIFTDTNMGAQSIYPIGRIFPNPKFEKTRKAKFIGVRNFAKPIFNLHHVRNGSGPVFVLEAPWDVITLKQWGYQAVGISGAYLSAAQKDSLLELGKPLIPIPDNDEAGMNVLKVWQENLPNLQAPLFLPKKVNNHFIKDPNDLLMYAPQKGAAIFDRLAHNHYSKKEIQ